MTEEQLQAIKERVEKATHGEWLLCHGEILTKDEHQLIAYPLPTGIEWENRHDKYFIENAVTDVQTLIAEVERLRGALQTIAFTPKFKLLCEVEAYAELALEGRESEWVEVPFDSELKILREAIDHKNEVHDALNRDYVKVRDENNRLKIENAWLKTNMKNIATDKNWRIAPRVLAGESNE